MRINYDFNDLEAFVAVMETGSFHVAGNHLNLSQSAITRRIQKLEKALGSPLFERTTRAVKPTLAAKRLQIRAENLLESAEETAFAMRDESVAFAHQRNAIVTVAAIPTVLQRLLIPAINQLRTSDTDPRVRILDLTANGVAEAVANGDADFGLCSIGSLEPNTVFEPLFDDRMVLVALPDHRFAAQSTVSWSDLADERLILPARGTGNRLLIDEAMAKSRLKTRWSYEVGRTTTALELAVGSVGVAVLPHSAITRQTAPHLLVKSLTGPEISRPIGLVSRQGLSDSATVTAFKSALRACAAGFEVE